MPQHEGIVVKHTADRMKAYIVLAKNLGPYDAGMVLTELLHHGIVHGLNTAIIHKAIAAGVFDKFVEVASGTPSVPGTDGAVEILPDAPPSDEKGAPPVKFVKVKAGDVLARRVPPKHGTDGMDVFGGVITAPQVKDAQLSGGKGTKAAPGSPDQLIAEYGGAFYRKPDGEIEVRPFKEIDGSAGGETFDGDLLIGGAVTPGASVEASGAMVVKGSVQGAAVKCGGDLLLQSPVTGGAKSVIKCGGSVWANCVENTTMAAEGDVTLSEDAVNCGVVCKGVFKARNIVGGSVAAAGGVHAVQIGSEAGTRTVIDVTALHNYVNKIENVRSRTELQNAQSDGYASDLYRFVRCNMDESGEMPEDKVSMLGGYIKNLTDSVALSGGMEKDLEDLSAKMKALSACEVTAEDVYPNVQIKLGFSELNVTEPQKNLSLKPTAAGAEEES